MVIDVVSGLHCNALPSGHNLTVLFSIFLQIWHNCIPHILIKMKCSHLYGYPLTIADFLFNVVSYSQLDTTGLQTVNATSETVDGSALVEFIGYGSTAYLIKGDIVAGDVMF